MSRIHREHFQCGNSNRGFIRNRISRRGERTERCMLERIGVYRRGRFLVCTEAPPSPCAPRCTHELWPTHGRAPIRDANAAVERTVSHFHRKFTLMAFALHTSRALCETANRGQLQFISWCGRVRGFQTTRYTGLSWPISVIFCPRLHAS